MKKECCDINELIEDFYNYLKHFTLKKVRDETIAEDIVQEVMMKLVESHQKNTDIENIKAWLFQVARNTIYDHFKKNSPVVDLDDVTALTANESTDLELSVYDYMVPMIQFLPKKYAEPLQWSDIDNLPQKDIAKKLNLGYSAAKMRVQRARTKLRDLFVECCDIEYGANGNFVSCTVKESCTPLKNHLVDFQASTKHQ
ncbi:MAG: sigma-70 family RNA polymerase sigma factor [Muricauda sp.]|nr:sigma-70 family RNA polymerase sigma factor [Allomuricauda sp.]MBA4744406.1 sigma-70 family RNA polymerase sigma factor [Allomuricauda sp.]